MAKIPSILRFAIRAIAALFLVAAVLWLVKIDQVAVGEGLVASESETWMSSRVEARVESVLIKEGEMVAPGDTLVKLDGSFARLQLDEAEQLYRTAIAEREVSRAELEILETPPSKNIIAMLQSELRSSREQLDHAEGQLRRERELMLRGGLTSAEELADAVLDSKLTALRVQKIASTIAVEQEEPIAARIRKARFDLQANQALVRRAEVEISKKSRNLADHSLVAPDSGRVHLVSVRWGDMVAVGDSLLLLVPNGRKYGKCMVPAKFGPWLEVGQRVTVSPVWERSFELSGQVNAVRRHVERNHLSVLVDVSFDSSPPLTLGDKIRVEITLRRSGLLKLLLFPFDWEKATTW